MKYATSRRSNSRYHRMWCPIMVGFRPTRSAPCDANTMRVYVVASSTVPYRNGSKIRTVPDTVCCGYATVTVNGPLPHTNQPRNTVTVRPPRITGGGVFFWSVGRTVIRSYGHTVIRGPYTPVHATYAIRVYPNIPRTFGARIRQRRTIYGYVNIMTLSKQLDLVT